MKTNIFAFIAIITATLLTSCTKEIEFKGEQIDPKLVINSIMEPGQPVKAYISKSMFFLDNNGNTQAPDDLVATLFVNGNRIGTMTTQFDTVWDGYQYVSLDSVIPIYKTIPVFINEHRPSAGDVVSIKASANGFDDAEGKTSPLPNAVTWHLGDCQTIDWEEIIEEYEEDTIWSISGQLQLSVEIADPNPGQTDFFRIHFAGGGYSDYETGNSFYISTSYDDPVFGANISNDDYFDFSEFQSRPDGVFTDLIFDGRSYQLKLPLYFHLTKIDSSTMDFFQVYITIEHLTKEYYNYLFTCEQNDEITQFFAEPIQTFSNIDGGYGILGGRTIDTLWFTLPTQER